MFESRHGLSLGVFLAAAPLVAAAEPDKGLAASSQLREVVVTATRKEVDIARVPATVTTVDRAALDRRMPHDEAALFADDPDIVVGRDLRRYGAAAINVLR